MVQVLTLFIVVSVALHSEAFQVLEGRPASTYASYSSSTMLSMTSSSSSAGPRAAGRRQASRGGNRDSPKARTERRQRKEPAAFDGKSMAAAQTHNEEGSGLDLESTIKEGGKLRCMTPDIGFGAEVASQPFTFMSLDDLFGADLGFSEKFNTDKQFRVDLRTAIRKDIFDTTPFYANLSEKAMACLLLPDSSLEGSWRMPESMNRMNQTTEILKGALGQEAPTGDELFKKIGELCGPKPTTHWIDIFGVQDRKISHSWHLDSGSSPENSKTVLWGFPAEDHYEGCGVFSHVVPLQNECVAPKEHPRLEPILFDGTVDEEYIVRPKYEPGRELTMYRDIDVIHSAPDVTYRTSIMRFM